MTRPLLRPADVHRLLAEHGLAPSRSFGQNFVIDANTVRKVARDAGVGHGDLVVEIGPGLGSLTLALREAGARVVAVEVDAGMVRALEEVVGEDEGVRVVHDDALRCDLDLLRGGEPAVCVANLPYNIATPLVMRCLTEATFTTLLVMVQREVGKRWVASVGDELYAAVSVKVATLADARIVGPVSRRAFHPVPNVDSVTVRLVPRAWDLEVPRPHLFRVVEAGFAQRRKRLRNALASGWGAGAVEEGLEAVGLHGGSRAEELDPAVWSVLAARLPVGS